MNLYDYQDFCMMSNRGGGGGGLKTALFTMDLCLQNSFGEL